MILVTGATGFVGQAIITRLHGEYQNVQGTIRTKRENTNSSVDYISVGSLDGFTDWSTALVGINVIIHTAARVHVMSDASKNPLEEFRKVNTDGTMNLARQAANSGVKRFIYLSSIKVNGESTLPDYPFTAEDGFVPTDPYALSKYEAEQGLLTIAKQTQMDVVIIRPPLVYGPGVKANFLTMIKWLYRGIPLPFGAINNKRSLVCIENLVDLIITCINHPAASNQIFLVSDGEDLSTSELLNRIIFSLGKKTKLLPVNQNLLELILTLLGKKALAQRLCGSLQIDISKVKTLLNWIPPVSVNEGLSKTSQYFLGSKSV